MLENVNFQLQALPHKHSWYNLLSGLHVKVRISWLLLNLIVTTIMLYNAMVHTSPCVYIYIYYIYVLPRI